MLCFSGAQTRDSDLSVGNSAVRAYFSQQGEWLGMFPSWAGGGSLFDNGGFILIANDENGKPRVVVNTAEGKLLSLQAEGKTSITCCEGMKGGNRAPSLNPDDDSDGQINEDRFDGIDNDGDDLVDEDFAAIGDEMVVSEFETRRQDDAKIRFHQESYSWALSHIEGMVAIRLLVENAGTAPLEDVRIGAFLKKKGPFTLSEELFTNRANAQRQPDQARAVVCASQDGPAVALLFPDMAREEMNPTGIGWSVWAAPADEGAPESMNALAIRRVPEREDIFFGGLSPPLEKLEPGEVTEITVLLVAIRDEEAIDRTLVDVHRTYLGDGTHHFIPPPVPVTPVVVWGCYERIEEPENGLLIIIEKNQPKSVNFNRVTFISGIDLNDYESSVVNSGETEITIFGKSAERLLKKPGERIVLKGREENGAFFDAILNPGRGMFESPSVSIETAEAFWQTPGKLTEDLLVGSPNPFREQTSIFYEVPTVLETEDGREIKFWGTEETSLKVYDVTGRLVNILVDESKAAGRYRVDWRATDENDIPVASGVYYIKLQIGKRYITKRLLLLK
jgi:hypothetical protein